MFDLDSSQSSKTLDSPDPPGDAGKTTELGPPSISDPESTDPYLRHQGLPSDAAAALRHVELHPSDRPDSLGRIEHYEILRLVGRGAMGVVVQAFDTQLTRTVALKLMSPQSTSSSSLAASRFIREARSAAVINHPNVVIIHSVSEHQGVPYLVMEYVDGVSLMERIRTEPSLCIVDILRISLQIASGLAAAHRHGVIHRDIKPANIMLETGIERVKITDFGLARVLQDDSELTSQGVVVGTPAYMSPEQVNGIPLDTRSDLFSLGCVIYAMAAGHSPFRGENALGTARRIAHQEHVPLGKVNKAVPSHLAKVVDRLLEKDPNLRLQSADELVAELTAFLARANQQLDSGVEPVTDWFEPRRRSGLIQLGLALILAIFAVLLAYRIHGDPEVPLAPPAAANPVVGTVLSVARREKADCSSIAEAIAKARPGQIIRVIDSATYEEPLRILDPVRLEGVRLETSTSAVIRAPGERQVVAIRGVARLVISGFLIEAERGQHAIDVQGDCPGLRIENCEIVCPSGSDLGVIYLHRSATGSAEEPIRLASLGIRCGGVGVIVGEIDEPGPVSYIEVSGCRIRAASRDHGVAVVIQGDARHVSVRRNLLATARVGVSFLLSGPNAALDVIVAENSMGDLQFPIAILNQTLPDQGIQFVDNLIIDASSILLERGSLEPFAGWFLQNVWEREPGVDGQLDALFPPPREPLKLKSRDPSSGDFLKPDGVSPFPKAGRFRDPNPPRKPGVAAPD